MPRARDFLERLRPVGAPGAAGPVGVPADRRAEIEAELEPVFAALAEVEAEVARGRRGAEADAAVRRERAAARAAEILARARAEAEAERAAVAARLSHQADVEAADALAEAEREADRVRLRARRRLPAVVAAVVDRARAGLAEVAGIRSPG